MQIYGVDIDPDVRRYLSRLLLAGATPEQFLTDDFFNIAPGYFGDGLFAAVVGNPPYVRYHDIPQEAHKRAITRLESFDIQIPGRASYWAFFLLYSMQFLRPGGRLAMVLPGAFIHTDYSTEVRDLLIRHFEEVTVYLLEQRIFHNTDEETVLICAAGARKPHAGLRVGNVTNAEDLAQALANARSSTQALNESQGDGGWLSALVEPDALALYDRLVESPNVIRLGEWVKTRIGIVTGNNKFFILSRDEQGQRNIPDGFLVPIIRRAAHLKGLWVTDEDLEVLEEGGNEFLLLHLEEEQPGSTLPKAVQDYIEYGEEIGVSEARKCRDRTPWYVVPHTFVPPAFVPCMSAAWPRLVVNQSRYTCTNNILRLLWKKGRPAQEWLRLAIGTLSTLSQLSAELVGRSYGGGVLKLEPSELARLAVPLVPIEVVDGLAREVDSLLRENKSKATDAVDSALLASNIALTATGLKRLRTARDRLFLRRRQHRQDSPRMLSN